MSPGCDRPDAPAAAAGTDDPAAEAGSDAPAAGTGTGASAAEAGSDAPAEADDPGANLPAPPTEPATGLAARAWTRWIFGDWESLAALPPDLIAGHPDRALLALLAAAAEIQRGSFAAAEARLADARRWGCDRGLMLRVLGSGLCNTLGRAAALAGTPDRAFGHFDAALRLGAPDDDIRLLAKARQESQTTALPEPARTEPVRRPAGAPGPAASGAAPETFRPAWRRYAGLPEASGFLYLDSKSLPRSGLHYLRNSLAAVLGGDFSFCEWYQEPGCCRRQPCALTAYADAALERGRPAIRMVKSHDFELDDPDFAPDGAIRRLVLVRDPLFLLTSWWVLDQFTAYKAALEAEGIRTAQLYYRHDATLLKAAHAVVGRHFAPGAAQAALDGWLAERSGYVRGFLRRWGRPAHPNHRVLRYHDLPGAIDRLLGELGPLAPDQEARRAEFRAAGARFAARDDPFAAPSPELAAFLADEAPRFTAAAEALAAADPADVFGARADR